MKNKLISRNYSNWHEKEIRPCVYKFLYYVDKNLSKFRVYHGPRWNVTSYTDDKFEFNLYFIANALSEDENVKLNSGESTEMQKRMDIINNSLKYKLDQKQENFIKKLENL
jgi:hypothetical protein